MSRRTLINAVLFGLYTLLSVAVLIASIAFPAVRQVAAAPLRDLLLPAPQPIVIEMLYSTEKEAWLENIIREFEAENVTVDGRPIQLETRAMGSREMYLAVLEGDEQPVIMSPASSLQVSLLENLYSTRYGETIVVANDTTQCRSTVNSPLVLVVWAERANALWGQNPGSDLWMQLQEALTDPQGWASYGHPEWGFVKFGHTNPLTSNSGFQATLLMTYAYHNKTSGLMAEDILGDQAYQEWFLSLEGTIGNFGNSTGTYMEEIVAFGPSQYDIVAVYESVAIEQAANATGRYGELQVFYPPATLMSDHPFCVLNAEWVDPLEAQAAQVFIDRLLSEEAQRQALVDHGFRPADPSIALTQGGSPFTEATVLGLDTDLPPRVEVPPGNVLDTLLTFWARNVQP